MNLRNLVKGATKDEGGGAPTKDRTAYRNFLDILVSPKTHENLSERGDVLKTTSGQEFPVVNGIPVLVDSPQAMHLTPPAAGKISQNIDEYKVPSAYTKAERILHLGSGNVKCTDKRVISLDILPLENVDVVGEAEALPFANNSFDLIESGAVFEHLYDPLTAIREIKRTLRAGGTFRIDNSFLQPYHGFPSHYFAMTPQANETYLVDDFILLESSIPESGTPLMALSMVLDRFLLNQAEAEKKQILKMPVGELLDQLKSDLSSKNKLMKNYSEYEKRSMAATHVVIAQKPANYEQRLKEMRKRSDEFEQWTILKRQYYTLRTELMLRYHEIYAYRRFVLDSKPSSSLKSIVFPKPLKDILVSFNLKDPFDMTELKRAIAKMDTEETGLTSVRDQIITIFVT